MSRPKNEKTKYEILQCSTRLFLEKGFTDAYVTIIAKELNISTGNLTFWFPTKEHILAELVRELFAFQWRFEENEEKILQAYLAELLIIASVCEDNPNIKDLIHAVYTHPMSLEVIRKYDTQRAKRTFAEYCSGWTEADFITAENSASGVEYAMLMTENTEEITFEQRVRSSLNVIMKIYDVPKDNRERLLGEVMSMDYKNKCSHVFDKFSRFVEEKIIRSFDKKQ